MCNDTHFDAFISYRRENGFYIACLIRDQLKEKGISAFLDLKELRSGEYDQKLYKVIRETKNFIVILPDGALNNCIFENDWIRKEIVEATNSGSNIIPILDENFQWPRNLYTKMPKEIQALEYFSGVKTSKDYLDAMIDRLISFMVDVEPNIETEERHPIKNDYISPEKYFKDGILNRAHAKSIDMAFHTGARWFTLIEKNDLLYEAINKGIRFRILLNYSEISEPIVQHIHHQGKTYLSFAECIQNWNHLQNAYPDTFEIKLVDIPILRRYYSFHMEDNSMDTVNVKYYTYGNNNPDKNYQPIFYYDSPYFELYRSEFQYLWEHGVELKDINKQSEHIHKSKYIDTVTFFTKALNSVTNISEIDMFFQSGSEWHLNSDVVDLLLQILRKGINMRIIVNDNSAVKETVLHMTQPLKQYYGHDRSLKKWLEVADKYPDLISVHVADVPLMRRYHNIKGKDNGIAKISYYTYGNYNPKTDYQQIVSSINPIYKLYAKEFEYLWVKGSHSPQ